METCGAINIGDLIGGFQMEISGEGATTSRYYGETSPLQKRNASSPKNENFDLVHDILVFIMSRPTATSESRPSLHQTLNWGWTIRCFFTSWLRSIRLSCLVLSWLGLAGLVSPCLH